MKTRNMLLIFVLLAYCAVMIAGCLGLGPYEDDPDEWPYTDYEDDDDDVVDDDDADDDDNIADDDSVDDDVTDDDDDMSQ